MLLAGLTACGGKQEEEIQGESTETESTGTENAGTVLVETPGELEVVAKLGTAEVTTEGEVLYFTITTPEGKNVRFQEAGVTITDGKLVVEPKGTIFSLDYIGEITNIVADGEGWINYGAAYAKTESVNDRTGLYAAAPCGIPLMEEVSLDVASYKSSFLALEASGEEPLVLNRLMLEYDADAAQMTFDMLETEPEIMEILNGWAYNWDLYEGQEEEKVSASVAAGRLAERKMEEPGSIYSDIIAGIDYDSIETKGNITFFSSVMSDGEVIRFEEKNISISEEGMTISIDVGYAYTYSAELTAVESMDELHTYPRATHAIMEWNNV